MSNQKGFTLVEGLLIALILSVIGFVGYMVWNNNQEKELEQTTTVQQESQNTTEKEEAPVRTTQSLYTIQLPEGWTENTGSTAPAGAPETYHEYSSEDGRRIGVSIKSGGFGGGGDGNASFTIEGNQFKLDSTYDACDATGDETGACKYGDGELYLLVSSASEYNGDNYLFWLWDDNSEEQSSYVSLKAIVETIILL